MHRRQPDRAGGQQDRGRAEGTGPAPGAIVIRRLRGLAGSGGQSCHHRYRYPDRSPCVCDPQFAGALWSDSYFSQDRLVAIAQAQVLQGGMQSGVTAWDVTTGGQVCSWQLPGFVGGITISPDERLIAALDTVGNIAI